MFDGKMKAISLSYDDCTTQDFRLVRILNKYGLKCTFNINSGLFGTANRLWREERSVAHVRILSEEAKALYVGHEVASHTLTHPSLKDCSRRKIQKEVRKDCNNLEKLFDTDVVGFAYPGGSGCVDARVISELRRTGVRYARTTTNTYSFDIPKDLMVLNPTVHHMEKERMESLADEFLALQPDSPKVFLIWGHSFELDIYDDWDWFENFCAKISGHDDIFYGTNREVLL